MGLLHQLAQPLQGSGTSFLTRSLELPNPVSLGEDVECPVMQLELLDVSGVLCEGHLQEGQSLVFFLILHRVFSVRDICKRTGLQGGFISYFAVSVLCERHLQKGRSSEEVFYLNLRRVFSVSDICKRDSLQGGFSILF